MNFPSIDTKTLAGRTLNLPQGLSAEYTLVVLVFEKNGAYEVQQAMADRWALWYQVQLKPQGVAFYEIPMMSAVFGLGRQFIDSGMRSGLPVDKHDAVACFYGDKSRYASALGISDYGQAHAFLLDRSGHILARASGEPTLSNTASFILPAAK